MAPPWTVCKFYLQGTCRKGVKCKYRHNVPGLIVKQQLSDPAQHLTIATLVDGHLKATFADGVVPIRVENLHYSEDGVKLDNIENWIAESWQYFSRDIHLEYQSYADALAACKSLKGKKLVGRFRLNTQVIFEELDQVILKIGAVPRAITTDGILETLEPRLIPTSGNVYTKSFPGAPDCAAISDFVEHLTGRRPTEVEEMQYTKNSLDRRVKIQFEGHARLDRISRDLSTQRMPAVRHLSCGASEYVVVSLKLVNSTYQRLAGVLKNCANKYEIKFTENRLQIHMSDAENAKGYLQITIKSFSRDAIMAAKSALERIIFDRLVPTLQPKTLSVGQVSAGTKSECPICLDESEEVVKVHACGHVSCEDCFTTYCATDNGTKFPVRCFERECEVILPTEQLRQMLRADSFNALASKAIQNYFRQNPEEFIRCPGPDCDAYYSKSDDQIHDCPKCFTPSCPSCNVEFHYGETCSEYTERTSGHKNKLKQWMKKEGVKQCPRCEAAIKKAVGTCNHMACASCEQHFCYTCLATFDNQQEVYRHMGKEHGGFFDDEQQKHAAQQRLMAQGQGEMPHVGGLAEQNLVEQGREQALNDGQAQRAGAVQIAEILDNPLLIGLGPDEIEDALAAEFARGEL